MRHDDAFEGIGDIVEYSDEEYDTYIPAIQAPLTQEQFEYYWGEDLLTLYYILVDGCRDQGLPLFETLSYRDFLELAYNHSSRRKDLGE